jgi:hypothetical protein
MTRPPWQPSSVDDVLRWGHARREALRRLGDEIPEWVAAIDNEYKRRHYLQSAKFYRRQRAAREIQGVTR